MFDDGIDPIGLIGGLLGGILALIVMSKVEVDLIFKIGSFVATFVVCYLMVGRILGE